MRKRIALVIQLFRESGKALYAMPALLLQPIYVSVFLRAVLLNFQVKTYIYIFFFHFADLYFGWTNNGWLDLSVDVDREFR